MMQDADEADRAILEKLRLYGSDAVSFQSLESGLSWWHDAPVPDGTGASYAYCEVGWSWIGVGTPLVDETLRAQAVARFAAAARHRGQRAVFFGVERLDAFSGYRCLLIGLQSELLPAEWPATLRRSSRLREQVRRARAKGVTIRLLGAADVAEDGPLRGAVERLGQQWLASRAMEPMRFLVSVEPFHAAEEHLYLIAERQGQAIQFLSAVPIYGRHGWLLEDMLRGASAPNGTTELLIDRLMREVEGRGGLHWITPGLTPLAGSIAWWLRVLRGVMVPLYDFGGLQRFRARLLPQRWSPVWMAWDRGPAPLVLLDVLRAFAGGRLVRFAFRSLVRHPNGPPWAVAVPLVPWTLLLAVLALSGSADVLGFSPAVLRGWIAFDAVLAWLLFKTARRPRQRNLIAMLAAVTFDALFSIRHLAIVGLGATFPTAVLRLIATAGPIVGSVGLVCAFVRARALQAERLAARQRTSAA